MSLSSTRDKTLSYDCSKELLSYKDNKITTYPGHMSLNNPD
jgi:hypothetical protein